MVFFPQAHCTGAAEGYSFTAMMEIKKAQDHSSRLVALTIKCWCEIVGCNVVEIKTRLGGAARFKVGVKSGVEGHEKAVSTYNKDLFDQT